MTPLSIISTVLVSTLCHSSGIASLTKTKPGTVDIFRNGSMYVDLPKVAMTSEPEFSSCPSAAW